MGYSPRLARESDTQRSDWDRHHPARQSRGPSSYSPGGGRPGNALPLSRPSLRLHRAPCPGDWELLACISGPTAGELISGLGRAMHRFVKTGPKATAQHTAQEVQPKATITLGLPHHQHVYPGELGGWGAGRRNRTGKTRERKRDKGTARSQKGNEASGSRLGQGLSCTSRRRSVYQGGAENARSPIIAASDILRTRNSG